MTGANIPNYMIFQPESELRHWLSKHGKDQFIDFNDA